MVIFDYTEGLRLLTQRLYESRKVVVLTGAGISAESGVPTFRDALTGLWAQYSPEDLATPEAFERNPKLVWDWYAWRRDMVEKAQPNLGHLALAELEKRLEDFTLVTQNVDSLHQRAGSRRVLEYHGNITKTLCSKEKTELSEFALPLSTPPCCSLCGAYARPGVVWFGEKIPVDVLEKANAASRSCDFFVSIGTSSLVYPAAGLAEVALRFGAYVVEINPEPTPLTPFAHFVVQGQAGQVLPRLL